ncbi:MAG: AMP-binding protein [Myxococcales bacterium]|nr:AMP-binding protein [Myxococcales bacterium]
MPTPPAEPGALFSVRETFTGKHLFVTGTTGFVGKVLLAMIAAELPGVRRVSVLVRTNKEYADARERFDAVVALSEPFQAVAERLGNEALQDWCDDVVNVVAGDVSMDRLGLSDDDYHELTETDPVDLILHCAGNVAFDPPLDQALSVNSLGVTHKLEFAKAAGCGLVHMSTCFVVGERSGPILEDPDLVGYSPNGMPFDPERELQDAVALAKEVRRRADAQVLEAKFYDQAREALTREGLDYENPLRLEDGFKTFKRKWINEELRTEGMARAKQWGWTNTYTYTKSIGEQCTIKRAAEMGVPVTIVRPAIVESSRNFPFEGWNEGVNTCAPIVYIFWKGVRFAPSNPDNILDLVPVDDVCRGTLSAGAALLHDRHETVYQFCSGDVNPLHMRRALELTNLAWRRRYDGDVKSAVKRHALRNMDTIAVTPDTYQRMGAPAIRSFAKSARKAIGGLRGSPLAPVVKQADKALKGLEKSGEVTDTILSLFAPFILDNNPAFSSKHSRGLAAMMVPEERDTFGFDLTDLDWRHYWMDVHMEGLQKWVFGELDGKMKRVKKIARAQDLIEVFNSACRAHSERRALSFYTADGGLETTYTYGELWESARRVASWLKAHGVQKGDAVLLLSPNEPAWPMIYVGILLADAAAVPIDPEMPVASVQRIAAKSHARLAILHEDHPMDLGIETAWVGDVFEAEPLEHIEQRNRSEEVASLLFTSGTTGDPKGVMLTHGNFTALLASLHGTFDVRTRDRFLSVLPLFHTFEFSCGFLMPASVGAHITYLETLEGPLLRSALKDVRPNGIIGIPALWDVLHRRIEGQVKDKGEAARLTFTATLRLSRWLRRKYGINVGRFVFREVHDTLGGRIRHLISGGASLSEPVLNAFEGLGFELLEGYGLTEAAPVLTVRRPGDRKGGGSVGKVIPDVEVQIINPDKDGVGEVVARGGNVMAGYLDDPGATERTIRKGWLHTGDLGKLDKDGRLTLVGRRKELIVTSSGKNVYPDELEEVYADHSLIEEMTIVGIPDPQGDERVAALVVLVKDAPDDAQAEVKAHFQKVGGGLPDHQRIRTLRFWHGELPRTATRKVKRKEVREELMRLLELSKASRREAGSVPEGREPAWLYAAVAGLTGMEAVDIEPSTHLITELGLGSLQIVELRLLLEERGGHKLDGEAVANAQTVADLVRIVERSDNPSIISTRAGQAARKQAEETEEGRNIPEPVSQLGRRMLKGLHQLAYDRLLNVRVTGQPNIPYNEQVIVIANHCSHLDLGLIKYALADYAPNLAALAASDYFFDTQYKRDFFEPFTNLIPVDRSAAFEASLRHAEQAMREGKIVLVFPEGTRSPDGQLREFKHGIGYLQIKSGLSVLPLYLRGTHKALPKGQALPTARRLRAHVGPMISADFLADQVQGKNRIESYATVASLLQQAIEALRDGTEYPWIERERKVVANPLVSLFEELPGKLLTEKLKKPLTWYFSIGDGPDGKWTLVAEAGGAHAYAGRPPGGKADCVLKTDERTFLRICTESYIPAPAEFMNGTVKTNDVNLLRQFVTVFGL